MKRLRNIQEAQANFWASGVLRLEEKLGPILWQVPANLRFDRDAFARFFDGLPRSMAEAAKIGRHHSAFMKDRCWLEISKNRKLRHAIEIRHESFMTEEFVELLRQQRVALVVADTAQRWPYMEDLTTDFVYARLHGDIELYASGYSDEALDRWARRFKKWRDGSAPKDAHIHAPRAKPIKPRDIYVYFDNDAKVHAPFNAMYLARRLGIARDYEQIKKNAILSGRLKQRRNDRRSPWPSA
jgi:uncharacterized protein YecE (DUF72 family)